MSVDFFANHWSNSVGCGFLERPLPSLNPSLVPAVATPARLELVDPLSSLSSSASTSISGGPAETIGERLIPIVTTLPSLLTSDRPDPVTTPQPNPLVVSRPDPVITPQPDSGLSASVITLRPDPVVSDPVITPRPDPGVISRPNPLISGQPFPDLSPAPLTLARTVPLQSQVGTTNPLDLRSGPAIPTSLVTINNLVFSGKEGDSGTFQVRLNLNQAPTSNIVMTFTGSDFLVVDADGNVSNGTQSSITFTPQNWNQTRTIWFIAETDSVSANRTTGNTISYSLSGGTTFSSSYNLGTVTNTYAPDLSRFNIDLDFRNDNTGFWTAQRRAIAQKAANDWANLIANEFAGFQLNSSINLLQNGSYSTNTFMTKRYVDDLVVFVNPLNSGGTAGGFGGPEYAFGGWSYENPFPRVAQIAIDSAVSNTYLYNAVLHELGHALGLVGLNLTSYFLQNMSSPQTAVFKGTYSTAANGGKYIPLQSQDGPNPVTGTYDYWHPSASINSVMSYGSIYTVTGPTAIDLAMLADSGYLVRGVNAPAVPPTTPAAAPSVATSSLTDSLTRPQVTQLAAAYAPPSPPQLKACACSVCQHMLQLSKIGESNLSEMVLG